MTDSFQYKANVQLNTNSEITTYGALIIPFDLDKTKPEINPKEATTFKGQLQSALNMTTEPTIKDMLTNPTQTLGTLVDYMKDNRQKISEVVDTVTSKFSGIAVTQAIMNGEITTQEALDYLFMGFAPALGVQGSLMGYSGLNQMKDALSNGSINVGEFINGFSKTLQGLTDLKDIVSNKENQTTSNIILLDLTLSHNETYQSETPDRRVQSGQSLNEYVHNMPETIEVQCALQEDKRYSKAEFRAILKEIRKRKQTVSLVLGDEFFDNLVLTNFNPNHECTKSGMDYTLSFKHITLSKITSDTEVTIQPMPKQMLDDINSSSIGGLGTGGSVKMPNVNADVDLKKVGKDLKEAFVCTVKDFFEGEDGTILYNTIYGEDEYPESKIPKEKK